jgi:hypothetical protein
MLASTPSGTHAHSSPYVNPAGHAFEHAMHVLQPEPGVLPEGQTFGPHATHEQPLPNIYPAGHGYEHATHEAQPAAGVVPEGHELVQGVHAHVGDVA